MSDIDFEELDQAVNQMTGDGAASSNSVPVNSSASSQAGEGQKPADAAASRPALSRKQTGSLIDVVHPSPNSLAPKTTAPTNRKNVNPVSADSAKNDIDALRVANDWPDPLDMPSPTNNATQRSEDTDKKPKPTDSQPSGTPPTTPFLAGTKVEKRPLGANEPASSETKEDTPQPPRKASLKDSYETELARPEFEKELVRLESDDAAHKNNYEKDDNDNYNQLSQTPASAPPKTTPPEPKAAPKVEPKTDTAAAVTPPPPVVETPPPPHSPPPVVEQHEYIALDDTPKKPPKKDSPHITALLASTAGASISQQYKSQPVGAPKTDQPLFNAEHYRQAPSPKAATATSTSTLQWIFIIVGLLLLGALLGATVFYVLSGQSLPSKL